MRSMQSEQPDSPPPLVFFIDRSLGRHRVAEVFRNRGHQVVLMADLYLDGADQFVGDDDWIRDVAHRDWVALSKDTRIASMHQSALRESTLRLFVLNHANLTGDEMAARFELHYPRIIERAEIPGPYVDVVGANSVGRLWEP